MRNTAQDRTRGCESPAAPNAGLEAAEGAGCWRVCTIEANRQDELRCVPNELEDLQRNVRGRVSMLGTEVAAC